MASHETVHQFYLGFDQATYDRVNQSTISAHDRELDTIADDDPNHAFKLLHTALERHKDVRMQSIYVRTDSWEASMAEDGHDAARAILLREIDEGMMGGTYIYPAHILLLVTVPIGARGILMSRATRRQLSQPRPVVDINIEPPSFAF